MAHEFLHNHPMMEKVFNIDQDHVVVDRKDWEEAKRRCSKAELLSIEEYTLGMEHNKTVCPKCGGEDIVVTIYCNDCHEVM